MNAMKAAIGFAMAACALLCACGQGHRGGGGGAGGSATTTGSGSTDTTGSAGGTGRFACGEQFCEKGKEYCLDVYDSFAGGSCYACFPLPAQCGAPPKCGSHDSSPACIGDLQCSGSSGQTCGANAQGDLTVSCDTQGGGHGGGCAF